MQIVIARSIQKGIEIAKEELYKRVDNKTVLFLSGGKTPKPLYEVLANEKIIKPAAVGLIDERYGKPFHKQSNERMISDTGLLPYFAFRNIPFYPILEEGKSLEETAQLYDEKVRSLFFHIPKSIGVLGIGSDGHTAGILPNRDNFINPLFDNAQKHLFVSSFTDKNSTIGKRITLTFAGLSLLDYIIVFIFGNDKKDAINKALSQGNLEEVPARFFQTREIAKKTMFITDQKV